MKYAKDIQIDFEAKLKSGSGIEKELASLRKVSQGTQQELEQVNNKY